MNRTETVLAINTMQAWLQGAPIEVRVRNSGTPWELPVHFKSREEMPWNWSAMEYRVAVELAKLPETEEDVQPTPAPNPGQICQPDFPPELEIQLAPVQSPTPQHNIFSARSSLEEEITGKVHHFCNEWECELMDAVWDFEAERLRVRLVV